MERLRNAGLNPDMMYSQNGINASMAGSLPGSTASGAPSVPQPAGESLLAQSSQYAGNAAKNAAEISLMRSQAKLNDVKSETEGDLNVSATVKNIAKAYKSMTGASLDTKQIDFLEANISKMNKETDLIEQEIQRLKTLNGQELLKFIEQVQTHEYRISQAIYSCYSDFLDLKMKEVDYKYYERYLKQSLKLITSQASLAADEAEISTIFLKAKKEIRTIMSSDGASSRELNFFDLLVDTQIAIMTNDAEMLEHNLEMAKRYGDFEKIVSIARDGLEALSSVVVVGGALKGIGKFFKKQPKYNAKNWKPDKETGHLIYNGSK